jgi:hypothetical protein
MANDRWYNPGDWYQLDDLSGFKIRASRSRRIPGGQTGNLIVAPERWEAQQPQDFVRGVVDDQTVPVPRPRQTNQFTILATFVTAPSARLSYVIEVDTSAGFAVGNNVYLMLDNGEQFLTSIAGIDGNTIWLGTFLPYSVGGNLGDPIENTLIFYNDGPPASTGLWNDSGVLALLSPVGFPTSDAGLSAGDVWNNMGAIAVVAGGSGSGQSYTFGTVTAGELLFAGAGGLTTSLPATAGAIWNNGGELAVA